ncbi:MAG: ABC transporter ATP-binding protein [Planctomycetia bacterium]|nr:ABC transporter ATP-binding protein [Planctomycetia bacterium]
MSEPLIDIRDVSFSYGTVCALRDVTLRIEPGPIGIVGNNGAGKSTLLKILLGLLRPTSGTGLILGCELSRGGAALRGLVGYMPEAHAVVAMLKGVEFVALSGDLYGMPPRDARRRAHEVLNYVGLGELRYRRLDEYSTGNLQRLKLAAALVHDPQLLLLDEPTNGLDPAGRVAMLRTIEDLIAETGKSVILCTHLLGDIERVCKQIVVMHQGTVAQAGTLEELRRTSGGRYTLAWQADDDRFVLALRGVGVEVSPAAEEPEAHDRRSAKLTVPTGWRTGRFFELAQSSGAVLQQVRPEQEDLEQLFFRVTQPERAAASGSAADGH